AWSDHLPVLRQVVVRHSDAAFVGTDGKSFATLAANRYYRWDQVTGRPIGPPTGQEFPVPGPEGWRAHLTPAGGRVFVGEADKDHFRARIWDPIRGEFVGKPLEDGSGGSEKRPRWAVVDLEPVDGAPVVLDQAGVAYPEQLRFWDVAKCEPF